MLSQSSIKESVTVHGVNVYNNRKNHITFHPAEEDSGLVFIVKKQQIPALLYYAHPKKWGISVDNGKATAYIVEHVLSPIYALGIDNLVIELSDGVCPTTDNSAEEVFQALKGIRKEQIAEKKLWIYDRNRGVTLKRKEEGKPDLLTVRPSHGFVIYYTAFYSHKVIGPQHYRFVFDEETYERDIMRARSLAMFGEWEWLFKVLPESLVMKAFLSARYLGLHGITERNYLLVTSKEAEQYANPEEFGVRYKGKEFVRHKVLDVIGTIALLGRQFKATEFKFQMTGHEFDIAALKRLDRLSYFADHESSYRRLKI